MTFKEQSSIKKAIKPSILLILFDFMASNNMVQHREKDIDNRAEVLIHEESFTNATCEVSITTFFPQMIKKCSLNHRCRLWHTSCLHFLKKWHKRKVHLYPSQRTSFRGLHTPRHVKTHG